MGRASNRSTATTVLGRFAPGAASARGRDIIAVRAMLAQRPQCSVDYEADEEFGVTVGVDTRAYDGDERAHRRRVAALTALTKTGEVSAGWVGISRESGWHGANRARMYWPRIH